jgi:hypothetical protein
MARSRGLGDVYKRQAQVIMALFAQLELQEAA